MFQRNKSKKEQKKHSIYLNIIQTAILVIVICTKYFHFTDMFPWCILE